MAEETETRPDSNAIGSPHPLYIPLWRIAVALEEQNRFNWEWMALNKTWRKENEETDIGSRVLIFHEENAKRDQSYREEILRNAEMQAKQTNEIIQASYEAYLESLKSPSKELIQAVQASLAEDIRRSTGARER